MLAEQRQHIETVMQVAERGPVAPPGVAHDEIIRRSWMRCVHQHKLDPARMQEAIILPHQQVREHQDQLDEFLTIARHGLETLYHQVAGLGYAVLLTDAQGVTVDFIGDIQLDPSLRKAGLYLGSNWNEQYVGTNGVGTCISTGEALVVHLGDHFDATHIPLTCTAAPIYGATGKMKAVLDISALSAPQHKQSQHLALQLVRMYSYQIENAYFLHRFRHEWILRLSMAPEFLEVNPEYLIAIDANGKILGHNRRAQLLFADRTSELRDIPELVGQSIDALLNLGVDDLPRFMAAQPVDRRAVMISGTQKLMFLSVVAPARSLLEATRAKMEPEIPAPLSALSGGDAKLDRQISRAARLLNSPISILITGETGSGKEFFAKALHQSSERRHGPFVPVNCAAIPDTLIESELFGYTPGSFSGAASKGKRGLIQEADGGTLFLDEIGDMPKPLQARLLRVLSEREVLPVGATRAVGVNIRVVAATHCDLEALVRQGSFRDDLYYRLSGAHFMLPPVRERQDLGWVIDRVLALHGRKIDGAVPSLHADTKQTLLSHSWPGNLRELRNVIEFASAVCRGDQIMLGDLPEYLHEKTLGFHPPSEVTRDLSIEVPEASELRAQLKACRWNVTAAAHAMGISRMTLYRRMKRYGIEHPQ
jgi:transcriptional regulator of acetoin/glycerol metabolism